MTRSLDKFVAERDQARFQENAEIARQNRTMRTELRDTTRDLAEAKKLLGIYEKIDETPVTPPTWAAPKKGGSDNVGTVCLELTDLHYGAVIRPEEINHINAYNPDIAAKRIKRTAEGTIKIARDYLAGVRYDGLQLFLPGDMHSGEIHAELRETNAVTVADGIVGLLEPLEAAINMLADAFGTVKIACVVGNHGRRTHKPISKRRVTDNYDYLTYRLLERDYKSSKKVSVYVAQSPDTYVEIYNQRYLLTHGDQFKGGGGISAELAPLLLGVHRKMRRDAAVGKAFDIMVMGHFHRTLMLPSNGLIVGGSVMGYDEYAFQQNLRPEPPQSAFWIATPAHGVTFSAPVFAAKRSEEGW